MLSEAPGRPPLVVGTASRLHAALRGPRAVGSKNKWEEANGAAVRERERKRATGHGFRGMGGGHARIFESGMRRRLFGVNPKPKSARLRSPHAGSFVRPSYGEPHTITLQLPKHAQTGFVKTLSGRTITVEAQTVSQVKAQVAAKEGIPADASRLSFGGASLADERSLESYSVESESTLHLNLELLGGGKKKKKKNYTTPKKTKHKHVKVKLAVLKMYTVDGNGKITRTRRECPAETCGAGVFMANHFDRQYCGRCYLTYNLDQLPAAEAGKGKKKK